MKSSMGLAQDLKDPDKRIAAISKLSDYVEELDDPKTEIPLVDRIMYAGMAYREPDVMIVQGVKEGELDPDDVEIVEEDVSIEGVEIAGLKKWAKRARKKLKKATKRVWKKIKKPLAIAAGIATLVLVGPAVVSGVASIASSLFKRKVDEAGGADAPPENTSELEDEIAVAQALTELKGNPSEAVSRMNEIRAQVGEPIWKRAMEKVPDAKTKIQAVGVETFEKQLLDSTAQVRTMAAVEAPTPAPTPQAPPKPIKQIIEEKAQTMKIPPEVIEISYQAPTPTQIAAAAGQMQQSMKASDVKAEDVKGPSPDEGIPTWAYILGGVAATALVVTTVVTVAGAVKK